MGQERCEPRLRPGESEAQGRHPARLPWPAAEGRREAAARHGRRQAAKAAALTNTKRVELVSRPLNRW